MAVEWKAYTHGTGADASLGHGFTLSVFYEGVTRLPYDAPHYNVTVFGSRLKTRSQNMDDGKERALTIARKLLSEALAKLD